MQVTTKANILKDAKIVKKNEAKAIDVQEKDNHKLGLNCAKLKML